MAIHAYVGLPGHGKSYGVVEHVIIPSLKQGRHVVTNIPLDADALLIDFGGFITQLDDNWHEIQDFSTVAPNGSVLVLDELWSRWPSGLKQEDLSFADSELLTKHRHKVDKSGKSMRIVLVTQDLSQIASSVRILIETTYKMTKLTPKRFRVDIYKGAVKGERPPKTALIRRTLGAYKPEVYVYYKSATQSETGEVGDETSADTRNSLFKNTKIWSLLILFIICCFLAFTQLKNFFSRDTKTPIDKPVIQAEVKETQEDKEKKALQELLKDQKFVPPHDKVKTEPTKVQQIINPKVANAPSVLWRIGGYVKSPNEFKGLVVLRSISGVTRTVPLEKYCKLIDSDLSISCIVDKQLVTAWTGDAIITQAHDPTGVFTTQ